MKRIVLLVTITVTLILIPHEAKTGEYHNPATDTLACSDCHSIHGTQGGTSMLFYGAAFPSANLKLLRADTPLQLCRYCHEVDNLGMGAPDVWYNTNYIPSAGDFADRGTEDDTNRHNMGDPNMKTTLPPGYNQGQTIWNSVVDKYGYDGVSNQMFTCLYCHNQHGNKNYRNLRYDPGNPANDSSGAGVKITYYNASADPVNCRDGTPTPCDVINDGLAGSGTARFERGNVTFNKVASDTNGIAPWCGKCHSDFHGAGGAGNVGGSALGDTSAWGDEWVRHPVRDVNIGEASSNLHADLSNWSTGVTTRTRHIDPNGTAGDSDDQPFCFSCHYVHGGGNPNTPSDPSYNHSNLVKLDSSGNLNLQGTGDPKNYLLRNICQQCHNQ